MLVEYWTFETSHGHWAIARSDDGRWHPVFRGYDVGSYHSPEAALEDLVGGHTFTLRGGVDARSCGLPSELSGWTAQFSQLHWPRA